MKTLRPIPVGTPAPLTSAIAVLCLATAAAPQSGTCGSCPSVGFCPPTTPMGAGPGEDHRCENHAGAFLVFADLSAADLSRADLSGAVVWNALLPGATMVGADVSGADFLFATMIGVDLTDGVLVQTSLTSALMTSAILVNADLSGADLTGTTLFSADLTGATLPGATAVTAAITNATLIGADFSAGVLMDINLSTSDASSAIFDGADLTDADLTSITAIGASLASATLVGADLIAGTFQGADFSGAQLVDTDLTLADLTGADFSQANVNNAVFAGADLSQAVGLGSTLGFAIYDCSTTFAGTGFDPLAAGWVNLAVCGQCVAPSETPRLGTPPNPQAFLPGITSPPLIGSTWDPVIDHTTFAPSAQVDFAGLSTSAANVPLAFGTLLCGPPIFAVQMIPAGSPFAFAIPVDCTLPGQTLCCAAGSITGAQIELTNALDITIGAQ